MTRPSILLPKKVPFYSMDARVKPGHDTGKPSTNPARPLTSWSVASPDLFSYTPPAHPDTAALLPDRFKKWFAARGWSAREHQLALLGKARDNRSALLIAPTGAGKTLAGFLPTLVELSENLPLQGGSRRAQRDGWGSAAGTQQAADPHPNPPPFRGREPEQPAANTNQADRATFISTGRGVKRTGGLHTLYISPLKALAVDIARNLDTPVAEMGLPIKVE